MAGADTRVTRSPVQARLARRTHEQPCGLRDPEALNRNDSVGIQCSDNLQEGAERAEVRRRESPAPASRLCVLRGLL